VNPIGKKPVEKTDIKAYDGADNYTANSSKALAVNTI
jgi:hypothetical protein